MTEQPQILYIEDNHDNQRLVQRVLGARGYTVLIAQDGPGGITLARESCPLLILVDLNIPGLDGYETTTRLRSMPHLQESPIVALTADVSPGSRERALVAGCDGYLTKPISPRELPNQVAEFIAGKREFVPPTIERDMLRAYNQKVVAHLEQRVRELIIANAELQEVDRLKSQFLSSLSHELRTPLTSLLGYIDLLSRGTLGALNGLQRDALRVMQRNAELLNQQLKNLLYLQEARSQQLFLTSVSLTTMVQHILTNMQTRATENEIRLDLQADNIAPIRGDSVALEVAISNLIDNGIKYTLPGGRVTVVLHDEPSRVIMRIEDTGLGIADDALEKIFLPFYRVDNSMAGDHRGNGIGLALVRHIIEAHGGQVTVRSVLGEGSVFTVVLPRQ